MKTSEETNEIIKALTEVQKNIKQVSKDRKNPFANSEYATLDNILEEVKPILNEHNIFLTQEPLTETTENNIQIGIVTRLLHTSGEFIEYEPLFMNLEKGAKMNMAQSAGSIITYAKRYSLSAVLGISTGDDTDGVQPNNQQQNNHPTNNQQPTQAELDAEADEKIKNGYKHLMELGISKGEINKYVIEKEGVNNINQVDKPKLYGHLKVYFIEMRDKKKAEAENKKKKQQEEQAEQGSLMQGNTTNPINWGQ